MDLATVDHLLTSTRCVRTRLDLKRPVKPEILERCIEIAMAGADCSIRTDLAFRGGDRSSPRKQGVAEIYRRVVRENRSGTWPPTPILSGFTSSKMSLTPDTSLNSGCIHPCLTSSRIFRKYQSSSSLASKAGWNTKG